MEEPERSRVRRRRNSDSSLYRKPKDTEMGEIGKERERFLGDEKYAFVQRYLENAHEALSALTETTDSGIKTHGAPSELGVEDISGNYGRVLTNFGDLNLKAFLRCSVVKYYSISVLPHISLTCADVPWTRHTPSS